MAIPMLGAALHVGGAIAGNVIFGVGLIGLGRGVTKIDGAADVA
jgi:hypothetical protein